MPFVTGNPSLSLPLQHSSDGLPIGMMFTARYLDEAGLKSSSSCACRPISGDRATARQCCSAASTSELPGVIDKVLALGAHNVQQLGVRVLIVAFGLQQRGTREVGDAVLLDRAVKAPNDGDGLVLNQHDAGLGAVDASQPGQIGPGTPLGLCAHGDGARRKADGAGLERQADWRAL